MTMIERSSPKHSTSSPDMSKPSVWWPVPHRPRQWFSADELQASKRYNRPVRRAAVLRSLAQFCLLTLGMAALLQIDADVSWWFRLSAGISAVVVSWWLPTVIADAWFEYRHEPRLGHRPLSARKFAVGLGVAGLAGLSGVGAAAVLFYGSMSLLGSMWWFGAGIFVVAGSLLLGVVGPALSGLTHQLQPMRHTPYLTLARGLDVDFVVMASDGHEGPNAMAMGWRRMVVAVTPALLEADIELQEHVVAHELSHVRHRDAATALMFNAALEALALVGLGSVLAGRWGTAVVDWLETEGSIGDPRFLPVVALSVVVAVVMVRPFLAWLSRAHERRADMDAYELVGPTPDWALRQLHVTTRGDLDPPRWVRLFSSHPSAAERLELAKRLSRG